MVVDLVIMSIEQEPNMSADSIVRLDAQTTPSPELVKAAVKEVMELPEKISQESRDIVRGECGDPSGIVPSAEGVQLFTLNDGTEQSEQIKQNLRLHFRSNK